ncbi:hypothetical protein Q4595_12135 [Wenyingzhuangia sp. 1_MG-2023]|nr:hypothetical protein [Wenyingzhuangia sp. 1_MG-2023]
MKLVIYIFAIFVFGSCSTGSKANIASFKEGNFKTYLGARKDSSYFSRTHNLQIEHYKNQVDTFSITWKSDFEYELRKVNPQSKLDSIPFIVKITGFKENSYQFKGSYLGSNFKQEGITYKK